MGTQTQARPGSRRQMARRERQLGALAARQHGVLSREQLIDAGLGVRTIQRRVEAGRIHKLHRGVYAFGAEKVNQRGAWFAAVLACGDDAVLSHQSAAALWGLMRPRAAAIDVTSSQGRPGRDGIRLHQGGVHVEERVRRDRIPVTSVARTLLDLAEVVDRKRLARVFEEADRLNLLEIRALGRVCERGLGRRGLAACRQLMASASMPVTTRSLLENRFSEFCREHLRDLPEPDTNVSILDHEVDAYWPALGLIVELDGFAYHKHRAAFERDRTRDAAFQTAGYRVIRITHRRLENEASAVASQLRALLSVGLAKPEGT